MQYWNQLNLTNNIKSDIPQYYIFFNGQLGIYPRPAVGYNPITIRGQVEVTSIGQADVTAGTITSVPYVATLTTAPATGALTAKLNSNFSFTTGNYQMITAAGDNRLALFTNGTDVIGWAYGLSTTGSTTITLRTGNGGDIVTATGTSFTSVMSTYYLQVAQTGGDGFWYAIDSVYDTTHLALVSPYGGQPVTSASLTIGQGSIIPPSYQLIPIYRAANVYFTIISKDESRAGSYKALADSLEAAMKADFGNKSTDPTVEDTEKPIINPNLTINTTGSSQNQ
jgi:hypothetical protein